MDMIRTRYWKRSFADAYAGHNRYQPARQAQEKVRQSLKSRKIRTASTGRGRAAGRRGGDGQRKQNAAARRGGRKSAADVDTEESAKAEETAPEENAAETGETAPEESADKAEEAAAEETADAVKEKTEAQKPQPAGKLDDFGEKIGGARKDVWSSRGLYGMTWTDERAEAEKYSKRTTTGRSRL
jgi:hypothetical protein